MKFKLVGFLLLTISLGVALTRDDVWGNGLTYFIGWSPIVDTAWILDVNGDTIYPMYRNTEFPIGSWNIGEAYCWGGWDTPETFLGRINSGVCPGSYNTSDYGLRPDGTSNARYYLAGIDCAAFVNRCLQLPFGQGIVGLKNCCLKIARSLIKKGDVLCVTHHARLVVQPELPTYVHVLESISQMPIPPKVRGERVEIGSYEAYSIFPQFANEKPTNETEVYEKRPEISVEVTGSGVVQGALFLLDGKSMSFEEQLIQNGKKIKCLYDEDLKEGNHTVEVRATNNRVNLYEDEYTWSFAVHAECPVVVSTDPADGASEVDVYKNITITFNKEMDQSSVNSSTVLFSPALVGGFTPQWSGDNKTVTLILSDPQQDLKFLTNYTITVTDGVRDIDGTQLDGDKDGKPGGNYVFSFTTRKPNVEFAMNPTLFVHEVTYDPHNPPPNIYFTDYSSAILTNNEQRDLTVNFTATGGELLIGSLMIPAMSTISETVLKIVTASDCHVDVTAIIVIDGNAVFNDIKAVDVIVVNKNSQANCDPPDHDHPDENWQVNDPQYSTPWYVGTDCEVGILISGYCAGLGHLLGRFKIPTAIVGVDGRVLGTLNRTLDSLKVLIIPSGGLYGKENNTQFKERISNFVENGGAIICMTQQYGYEWGALPIPPTGYGWRDRNCSIVAFAVSSATRLGGFAVSLRSQETKWGIRVSDYQGSLKMTNYKCQISNKIKLSNLKYFRKIYKQFCSKIFWRFRY